MLKEHDRHHLDVAGNPCRGGGTACAALLIGLAGSRKEGEWHAVHHDTGISSVNFFLQLVVIFLCGDPQHLQASSPV